MSKSYQMNKSQEAKRRDSREYMMEADVLAKNAFVKGNQQREKKMWGDMPSIKEEYHKFDACMMNNGEDAKEFARSLTSGLDKEAFPVK